jgi:ribosomal protein S7
MPRRRSPKKKVLPDPKYGNDIVLAKFMNNLNERWKKSVLLKKLYMAAFDQISKSSKERSFRVFDESFRGS